MSLIKRSKSRFNNKINFPRDTERHIHIIAKQNVCSTQVVYIFHGERDNKFIFKVNLLSILPKPVELSHEWVLTNFKYQEPEFYAILFY